VNEALQFPGDDEVVHFKPQDGPQYNFLATQADIAIYGGAAGGGKSYGLLLDPLRHVSNGKFGGTIFRRTSVQVRNEGGLWDESMGVYPHFGGHPGESRLRWKFPSGMSMGFANLEYDKDVFNFQGAQIPWIGFDELTHFTMQQFFYMLSRNRSMSGVRPRIKGTCNPDPDSWVRTFIDWWIGEDGFPIKERSGVLRWFIRLDDKFIWADTKEEIHAQYGYKAEIQPKSVTFIPSKLQDNKILMEKDPSYLANLLAQSRVDRMRLLEGNWNVRAAAGMLFQRQWFPIVDAIPGGWLQAVRFWDRAATKPSETNRDPDWTRGLKIYKYPDGRFVVADLKSMRDTPGQVESLIRNTASHDSYSTRILSQQDPGSAGVAEAENFVRMLSGYDVRTVLFNKDKLTRAKPVSAQAEVGAISVLRAPWNDEFFSELENFPEAVHDDIVDVLSGGFNSLSGGMSLADV
jgi:predicted phage terminase large subunit-like protein